MGGALILVAILVLAFLAGGFFSNNDDGGVAEGADASAASTGEDNDAAAGTTAPAATTDEQPSVDETAAEIPDGFVAYEGRCFSAVVPDSWTLTEDAGERSYGRRTAWSRGNEELFVDSSPLTDPAVTGKAAAAEQLGFRNTATSGLIEEAGRDDMWSYTYTRSGRPSIAIYFIDGRGFGIVGSSSSDPDAVVAEARSLAASIQVTNPDC